MENFKSVHQMEPLVMGTRTYLGQIYHAHNEDNDEDKNFNKNETLSFTQLLYLIDFYLHLLGACEPNNMIPVTILYGLIPDNAIKSPSLVKHATEKTIHTVVYDSYTYVLCCS